MGVGVLIGRSGSGSSKLASAPAQVISVATPGTPGIGTSTTSSSPAAFTGDWPAGTDGYTVQLQTLPQTGTLPSAVAAAKAAATTKGAPQAGALQSSEYSSLPVGNYVIYSGVYPKKTEAEKALASLRKSFPAASVVKVASGSGASAHGATGSKASSSGLGSSPSKPAPPAVVQNLRSGNGGSYEQKSKSLPNVISTG
jgi:hypothetical protein